MEPTKCEGVSQAFIFDCQTSARPCSLKENPLQSALPLPPVNASSHNMRNPPSGRAPPTSRGIPWRWPLEEAGSGQANANRDWLARQGSTPLRLWSATGSPPFHRCAQEGVWWPLTPRASQSEMYVRYPFQLPNDPRTQDARRDARHRTTGGGVKIPIPSSTGIEMRSLAGSCGPRQGSRPLSEPHALTGSWKTRSTCGSQCS